MKSWILQTTIFAIIAALCALGTYWVKGGFDRRIPCDASILKESEVCLDTVLNEWKGDVVWIDARDQKRVSETIKGALTIWPGSYEDDIEKASPQLFIADQNGKKAIVFCATKHCGNSKTILKVIRDQKKLHSDIYYLHGGWEAIEAVKEQPAIKEKLPIVER